MPLVPTQEQDTSLIPGITLGSRVDNVYILLDLRPRCLTRLKKKKKLEWLLWVSWSHEQLSAQLLCARKWVPDPRMALKLHPRVHLLSQPSAFDAHRICPF